MNAAETAVTIGYDQASANGLVAVQGLGAKLSDQDVLCENAYAYGIITAKGRARCDEMAQTAPPRGGLPAFLWDLQQTATFAKTGDRNGQLNFQAWYRMGMITDQFYTSIMGQHRGNRAVLPLPHHAGGHRAMPPRRAVPPPPGHSGLGAKLTNVRYATDFFDQGQEAYLPLRLGGSTVPVVRTVVRAWQGFLNDVVRNHYPLGGAAILVEDGVFGMKTRQATMYLQRLIGTNADGVVGHNTINAVRNWLGSHVVSVQGLGEYFWGNESPGDVRDGIFTTFAGVGAMDDKQKKMLIFGGIGAAVLLGAGIWYMKKRR